MKKLMFINLLAIVLLEYGATIASSGSAIIDGPITDSFNASIDSGNNVTGSGSGFNSGAWYEYRQTDSPAWWGQWYYDHPLDLSRWKIIDTVLHIQRTSEHNWIEVAVNWSTDNYPDNPASPPLPSEVGGVPYNEADVIEREMILWIHLYNDDVQTLNAGTITIPDYNPEWVSIDVRGSNVEVWGEITHECLPEPATIGLVSVGLFLIRRKQ